MREWFKTPQPGHIGVVIDVGRPGRLSAGQWQGAGTSSVREFATEFPFDVARRGYAVGSAVLAAVLPAHDGPTAAVPVAMDDWAWSYVTDRGQRGHRRAARSVSVAPFAELAHRYGDDLAIVWIDSNPDVGTPASRYPGFHAMAVAALTGHGDPDVLKLLPRHSPREPCRAGRAARVGRG